MKHIWLMTFEEFNSKFRTINSKQYVDDYYRLNVRHCVGCHYYLYVSSDLKLMNPYTKKDKTKKCIKSFASTSSALDVKEQAYLFILEYAKQEGLFDESICDLEIINRQLNYIENGKSTTTSKD
jgi:hypothetical protein